MKSLVEELVSVALALADSVALAALIARLMQELVHGATMAAIPVTPVIPCFPRTQH